MQSELYSDVDYENFEWDTPFSSQKVDGEQGEVQNLPVAEVNRARSPIPGVVHIPQVVRPNPVDQERELNVLPPPIEYFADDPSPHIMCVRGGDPNNLPPGRAAYMRDILARVPDYQGTNKRRVVLDVIEEAEARMSLFIRKERATGQWYVLPYDSQEVLDIVGQCLRQQRLRMVREAENA